MIFSQTDIFGIRGFLIRLANISKIDFYITAIFAIDKINQATVNVDMYSSVERGFLIIQ